MRWLSVDLPETVALRGRLLSDDRRGAERWPARRSTLAGWTRWADTPPQNVLVTAQGLLMYLPPRDVRRLIAACAERFPGGASSSTRCRGGWWPATRPAGTESGGGYRAPQLAVGDEHQGVPKVATASPRIAEVRSLPLPRGRGLYALAPVSHLLPGVRSMRMSIVSVRFGPEGYRNDTSALSGTR